MMFELYKRELLIVNRGTRTLEVLVLSTPQDAQDVKAQLSELSAITQ